MKSSAIGIIPARYASTRFPGKPLAKIHGKPMIQRVYERAIMARLDAVYVATDDDRIAESVLSFGGNVIMTSPNHSTGTERCAEALELSRSKAEIVINIQGDEPMIDPEHLNQLIDCFNSITIDIATLVSKMEAEQVADPNTVKVVMANDGRVLYFSRSAIPFCRDGGKRMAPIKHLGVYAYRTNVLEQLVVLQPSPLELSESLEQLRWLENGYSIKAVTIQDNGISVDTPEDLNRLLAIWKEEGN
ncbi:MAG: 3-deoxy-manno-octulosonate cytidylyltransferase (CMP-KDO synthetase) [Oceanospirillaceae bacterium]|jgi:3-deoxy-manno-octulosonate cytidylyltransferase (CMP-KDO synthetase)